MWPRLALQSRYKLATFDVTNTLLKFQTSIGKQYAEVAKQHGVDCDPHNIEVGFKMHRKILREKYPNFGYNSLISSRQWWKLLVEESLKADKLQLPPDLVNSISDDLIELYATEKAWKLSENVAQQLQMLKDHNIILGVISNFDERLNSVLVSTGLRGYFQFVLSSYIEGVEKPDRRIFDLALSKVQHLGIKASDAVHIGDDLRLDYLAAKNAGWSAYLLTHPDLKDNDIQDDLISIGNLSDHILKPLDK